MNTQIIESIFQYVDRQTVACIIYYGNRSGRDFDFLVLVDDKKAYNHIEIDNLDIGVIGIQNFYFLVQFLDPIVTEPIISGEIIYGHDMLPVAKKLLEMPERKTLVLKHLLAMSRCIWQAALYFYNNRQLSVCMNNIVFALSYMAFARKYSNALTVTMFKDVLSDDKNGLLAEAHHNYKKRCCDVAQIINFLNRSLIELERTEKTLL